MKEERDWNLVLYRLFLRSIRSFSRQDLYRVLIMLLFIVLASVALSMSYDYSEGTQWILCNCGWGRRLGHALVVVGPELAGIAIAVITIDLMNERRQTAQYKAQLIRQMGSPVRDVSVPAIAELAHHTWLESGALDNAYLKGAKLDGANLRNAYMRGANLDGVNLKGADLRYAHLEGALLREANLEGALMTGIRLKRATILAADLRKANLSYSYLNGAKLRLSHLEEAELFLADFRGADLKEAHLQGARLIHANLKANLDRTFLEETILDYANLEGAINLTDKQLKSASSIDGAIMPDGTKLKDPGGNHPYLDGPTLEEWLATKPDCLVWEEDEEE